MIYKKDNLTIYFLFLLFLVFVFNLYNVYHFDLEVFGERDLLRALNLDQSFEVYGADLGLQEGRRIPGGFNYYFLWVLSNISKNIFTLAYILLFIVIISNFYLFKKNYNYLSLNASIITTIIFFSSNDFLDQARHFWNPTLGIPFALLSHVFLFKYIESNKEKYFFLTYLNIFLASQFHMSYITLALSFFISIILIKKKKFFKEIFFITLAFIFAYFPFLINYFIPLINENINDYFLINSYLVENIKNENLFFWLIDKIYYSIIKLNNFILVLSCFILVLFFWISKIFLKKITIQKLVYAIVYLSILLLALFFLYRLNTNVLFLILILVLSLKSLNILTKTNIFFKSKSKILNFFNIVVLIFIFNTIFSFIGSYLTYGIFNFIIEKRYALYFLPIYSTLIGLIYFILNEWAKVSTSRIFKHMKFGINTIIILIVLLNFVYNIKINNNFSTDKHFEKLNIINEVQKKFNLSNFDLLNRVAISKYEDGEILPIYSTSLEHYINNKKNLNTKKHSKCFLTVTFNRNNNDIIKYSKNQKNFFDLLKKSKDKFMSDFSTAKLHQKENIFLIEYKSLNYDCPKNLTNDYILSDYDKTISKFLLDKNDNTSYKIKEKKFSKYYIKINNKKLNYPLNTLFEFKIKNDVLEINFFSKRLRNDNSQLNGYWSAVTLDDPEIIFINNMNNKKYKFPIIRGTIGKDFLQTPWKSKFQAIPKGNYTILFNGYKLREEYSSLKPFNLKLKLDENFIYE